MKDHAISAYETIFQSEALSIEPIVPSRNYPGQVDEDPFALALFVLLLFLMNLRLWF
jgi:hypothetical protein